MKPGQTVQEALQAVAPDLVVHPAGALQLTREGVTVRLTYNGFKREWKKKFLYEGTETETIYPLKDQTKMVHRIVKWVWATEGGDEG